MHLQRCEPRQIFSKAFLLLRHNKFFLLTRYFGDTYRLAYKKSNLFVYIERVVNCHFFQIILSEYALRIETEN